MKTQRDIPTEILARFMRAEVLRYRDGRPPRVANDLYNYHLQKLVKQGYITKTDEGYSLTDRGLAEVVSTTPISPLGNRREVFKVCVLCCVIREHEGQRQVLLQKRLVQPWIGSITILGGSIKRNELYADAATRKIKEEAGLEVHPTDWAFLGQIRGIKQFEEKLVQDIFLIVMGTEAFTGEATPHTLYGDNYWGSLDEAITEDESFSSGSYPALVQLYTMLKDHHVNEITPQWGEYRILLQNMTLPPRT